MLYKSKLLTLRTIGYCCCMMMSIVIGPKWPFYSCYDYIGLLGISFMQVFYLGRAPRTKETLPDFLKWRRVPRHPLVFRGLTGSQRTPGNGASQLKYYICNRVRTTTITQLSKIFFFLCHLCFEIS